MAVGIVSPVRDANAAEVAYQKGNYETALRVARPLAEQGDARAQSILGRMYARGRGVPLDEVEAGNWFRGAADRGNAAAQLTLGNMYAEGRGVPQDYAEAARWYRVAADQGDPHAQYNLGLSYAKGEGISRDNVSAHMWFNIAASRLGGRRRRARLGHLEPRRRGKRNDIRRDHRGAEAGARLETEVTEIFAYLGAGTVPDPTVKAPDSREKKASMSDLVSGNGK